MSLPPTAPIVFVSYSHDSPAHEAAVLSLANRLRADGIDAVLDQYESFPREGWIQWMKRQVDAARFIVIICTETYRRRADGKEQPGVGLGATYESQLIQQLLYNTGGANERFIPVVLTGPNRAHIPLELQRYTHYCLDAPEGYENLYRLLTDQPRISKPTLGPLRSLPPLERKPDFRNAYWQVPPRNPFFTGREAQLERLHESLRRTRSAALSQVQAISGLGGIGKTHTALEYAHRYRHEFTAAFWTGANSRDALLSGFAAIARLLGLPQKDDKDAHAVAASVRRWLDVNPGWLLVFDNVEDLNLTAAFAPAAGGGHLLLTTRLQATGGFAERVDLEDMEPEEGALFLLRRAKLLPPETPFGSASAADRKLALEVTRELAGLPLALDQAGAFIEEVPSTLAEYLGFYRTEGRKLRARRGELAQDHASVTVTFSLAFARVEAANPAAADLVRVCSFLSPDAIPEEIFLEGGTQLGERLAQLAGKPFELAEALKEAGRFSLIHRQPAAKTIDIHRLVQEVVKDEMSQEVQRTWAERVVRAVKQAFPYVEYRSWPVCDRLLPHALSCAALIHEQQLEFDEAARLLNQAGFYLRERARYPEAEPLYQRALAIREKASGPDHPQTAASLNNLAQLYSDQGRYDEAEPLCQRALAIKENALGPYHPDTATSLNNLAGLYLGQGRYAEAEPLFKRALAIREKESGPDHPNTAQSLNNLAQLYSDQGRYAEAEPLFKRALAIREKALGPDHPHTASSLNNLASLYCDQGRYTEAEPLHQRALAIREKALGPDHPLTATSLNNLALLYYDQGRYAEAEPLFKRALAIHEKALGPDHPLSAQSLNNLALLCHQQGRYTEAEALQQRALAILEKALGPDHPRTRVCRDNLEGLRRLLRGGQEPPT